MDRAFNVDIRDISIISSDFTFNESKVFEFLSEKIPEKSQNGKKVLDGKKLEDSWFKTVSVDFFISHKREDVEKAKMLGAYLQAKGKSVFIDSCIWGDITRLQKKIDDDYCQIQNENLYSYKKVNQSTSYTHMLLANALLKTIDNCENFVFLNTANSLSAENIITNTAETNSPWLYFEINVANALLANRPLRENYSRSQENLPEMAFEADLRKFEKVNVENFLTTLGFEKSEDWIPEIAAHEEKFR